MIGHVSDIPPITCLQGRIEQENDDEKGHEYHYDRHKFERPDFAVIPLRFSLPYSLYGVCKHDYRYGKHKVIAYIRIVFKEIPTEFVTAVKTYVEDSERKQHGKCRDHAQHHTENKLRQRIFTHKLSPYALYLLRNLTKSILATALPLSVRLNGLRHFTHFTVKTIA